MVAMKLWHTRTNKKRGSGTEAKGLSGNNDSVRCDCEGLIDCV